MLSETLPVVANDREVRESLWRDLQVVCPQRADYVEKLSR